MISRECQRNTTSTNLQVIGVTTWIDFPTIFSTFSIPTEFAYKCFVTINAGNPSEPTAKDYKASLTPTPEPRTFQPTTNFYYGSV